MPCNNIAQRETSVIPSWDKLRCKTSTLSEYAALPLMAEYQKFLFVEDTNSSTLFLFPHKGRLFAYVGRHFKQLWEIFLPFLQKH